MITYIYYMPCDTHIYKISCEERLKDLYFKLLIENGSYKIFLNNKIIYRKITGIKIFLNNKINYTKIRGFKIFLNNKIKYTKIRRLKMGKYMRYYVSNSELYDVMEALKILREKRLINKFAKSINISQPTLSHLVNGKTDLSGCTLTVYNKIVSNIDNFLSENNKEN